jgi:hypothetical protein
MAARTAWQEAQHLLTFVAMDWKRRIIRGVWRPLFCLLLMASPLGLSAQKGKLKEADAQTTAPPPGGGKGALKAAQADTLIGGDGFIPRTVIDSFPHQPLDSAEVLRPGTRVRRDELDASKARIVAMRQRLVVADSLIALQRSDSSQVDTATAVRWLTLDSLRNDFKGQLAQAEQDHQRLQARWDALKAPAVPENAAEAAPTQAPPSPQTSPAPTIPAAPAPPALTPGVPATPSGKAKVKAGNG